MRHELLHAALSEPYRGTEGWTGRVIDAPNALDTRNMVIFTGRHGFMAQCCLVDISCLQTRFCHTPPPGGPFGAVPHTKKWSVLKIIILEQLTSEQTHLSSCDCCQLLTVFPHYPGRLSVTLKLAVLT